MNWSWPDAKGTIAVIMSLSLIALIVVLIMYPGAVDSHPGILSVLNMLVGGLLTSLTTVINYYFGSSLESKSKGDTLAQIATNGKNSGAPKL
jgi:hypothetical protein